MRAGALIEKYDAMDAVAIITHFGWKTSPVSNKTPGAVVPVMMAPREPTDTELAFFRLAKKNKYQISNSTRSYTQQH